MRRYQIILFLVGAAAFVAAACFAGRMMGDTLWRAGIAVMLGDLVCIKLWPAPEATRAKSALA